MPTFYPLEKANSPTPWNEWLSEIQTLPEAAKHFAQAQQRTSGYVIAWWVDEKDLSKGPLRYLALGLRKPRKGETDDDKRQSVIWREFDDDTTAETPLQYVRLNKTVELIQELRCLYNTDCIGLVFWQHPDSHLQRRGLYRVMQKGHRVPGSPRQ